jgi:hypothetical protein
MPPAQVIICTSVKDTVEFLDHIMHVTNMSCLTPRTLLQVQRLAGGVSRVVLRAICINCCTFPTSPSPPRPLQTGCRFVAANLYAKSVSPTPSLT